MSPTWLEIAVAVVLLLLAWRIAVLLTPWILRRWRGRHPGFDSGEQPTKLLKDKQKR